MKKIGVTGYYGQGNYGDDLFCLIMSFLLNEYEYRIVNANVKSKSNIKVYKSKFINNYIDSKCYLGKFARVLTNVIIPFKFDQIVFGGGSVFGKYSSLKQRRLLVRFSKLAGTELYGFGISVGPFKTKYEEDEYIKLLSFFKLVVVRDDLSSLILEKTNIQYLNSQDMAFCLPRIIPQERIINGRLILALHDVIDYRDIVKLILSKNFFSEIIVLSTEKSDKKFSEIIFTALKNENLLIRIEFVEYWLRNIEDVVSLISSAEYIITSKLHGAITGLAYGRKVALFEYQEKCTELLKKVGFKHGFLNYGDSEKFLSNLENIDSLKADIDWSDKVINDFKSMVSNFND